MFTQNHDYVGYIIVLIDVTRETEMDQMKSDFISKVSKELEALLSPCITMVMSLTKLPKKNSLRL